MMGTTLIALLAAAQAAGGARPVAKPVKTTLEKLHARAHRTGSRVELAAVTLPATAVQVRGGGKTRSYALAVPRDGRYLGDVARAVEETRAALPDALRRLDAALEDDEQYKAQTGSFDRLLARLSKLQPDLTESAAVELKGFDAVPGADAWGTTVGDKPAPAAAKLPALGDFPSFNPSDALDKIKAMAAERPPVLSKPLPRYAGLRIFTDRSALRTYNRMVTAYDAELRRRRLYAIQLSREELLLALFRLERLLGFREDHLVAVVAGRDDLAAQAFAKTQGGAPGVWLREAPARGRSVAERHFARTSVLVTSYPAGATLTVNGQQAGPAPFLLPDIPVGTELFLALELPGCLRKETPERVAPHPAGVKHVSLVLDADPAAAAPHHAEVWLVESADQKAQVSQLAATEWPAPGGKTARPELILRCSAEGKEAYLYYPHGFGAQEGDLFARFDNETKPRRYRGVPSQDGKSLFFFTGKSSKGTDGFIKELLQHQTLALSVKPRKKDPLADLTFDLRGLEQALADWVRLCPVKR